MSNLEEYLKLLGQQNEVKEEEITIKRNPTLEKIIKSYEIWLDKCDKKYDFYDSKKQYNNTLKTYSRKKYSSKDIEDFSLELLKYQNKKYFENTGLFLSALINKSKDKEFTIITEHLDKKINLIGYKNKKIANVKGDAGNNVGWVNEGTITVERDVGNEVGWDNEGTVTVGRDAGNNIGFGNEGTITVGRDAGNNIGFGNGGTITVGRDAGNDVGLENKGIVKINGKIKSLNRYASGKIYQGGKLIRRKNE